MIQRTEYIIHSNCLLCKGHNRSAIYDLQRNKLFLIPNEIANFFEGSYLNLSSKISSLSSEDVSTLEEYIDFLYENDIIYPIEKSELEFFPPLATEWDYPSIISNIIVDNMTGDLNLENILVLQKKFNCLNFLFRFFGPIVVEQLYEICNAFKESNVQTIEFYFPSYDTLDHQKLKDLTVQFNFVRKIIIYDSNENNVIQKMELGLSGIFSLRQKINVNSCGIIDPTQFSINIDTYMESLSYNSCLNRKLSIDFEGNIKNCPSMVKSFGSINDKNLDIGKIVDSVEFQELWHISKDKIHVCKDCEFRHICTDCRAYVEDPRDIFSKPLKCGYNPYTSEWEDWSANPLKQNAIDYYQIRNSI